MKVILVNPPVAEGRYVSKNYATPVMGLGYIASFLSNMGVEVSIVDAKFENLTMKQTLSRLAVGKPDVIGITAMTMEIDIAEKIASRTKEIFPKIITVIGGAHAIALPLETLQNYPSFDMLVNGEGEKTFSELIEALEGKKPFDYIEGLSFRKDGHVQVNRLREPISDLDALPFPAWHLYPRPASTYFLTSARGCPFNCIFCQRASGKKVRYRSPKSVADEVEYLLTTYHPRLIEFNDETFTVNQKRTHGILDEIMRRGLHKKLNWKVQTRVDQVDYSMLKKMREAGCESVEFGIESGNEDILKVIKKGTTLKQIEQAVSMAKKAGLTVYCDFILGHPFETPETAEATIDFCAKLNPHHASIAIMTPFPGTEVARMAKLGEGGYKSFSEDWSGYTFTAGKGLELENLSRRQMEKLQIIGYLKLYLRNFRFVDLFVHIISYRRQALGLIRSFTLNQYVSIKSRLKR